MTPANRHDADVTELQIVLAALCAVAAVLVLVQLVRDRPPDVPLLAVLGVVELGLFVHLVVGVTRAFDAPPEVSTASYIGYLAAALVVLPLAVGWSWAERSRGGTAVILAGLVLVPYLFARLHQIWPTAG